MKEKKLIFKYFKFTVMLDLKTRPAGTKVALCERSDNKVNGCHRRIRERPGNKCARGTLHHRLCPFHIRDSPRRTAYPNV
jgi:hypothetical protein